MKITHWSLGVSKGTNQFGHSKKSLDVLESSAGHLQVSCMFFQHLSEAIANMNTDLQDLTGYLPEKSPKAPKFPWDARFENELISVWLNLHTFRYRSFHFLFGFMFYDASEDKLWQPELMQNTVHIPLLHQVFLILLLRSLYVAFAVFCVLNIVAWCEIVKHQNEPQNMSHVIEIGWAYLNG